MLKIQNERQENRHERADRISREYITAERRKRDEKTARLRDMRLKIERVSV